MKRVRYTKEQKEAIDSVKYNLDEFDNKPRRFYAAIREFAQAFLNPESKMYPKIIARIDQAERSWYEQWNFEREVSDMLNINRRRYFELTSAVAKDAFRKHKKRLYKHLKEEDINKLWYEYTRGVDDMLKEANRAVFHVVYPELDSRFERFN